MKQAILPLYILVSLIFISINIAAQDTDSTRRTIFDDLATPDSVTGATVKIHQDKRIESLLIAGRNVSEVQMKTVNGFRVQVFSSNVQRTAKNEAFRIEKEIKEIYPDHGVYVNYTSPFWKVRVGDFTSYDQAQAFRNELIKVFPQFKSETYPVKDKVFVPSSK